MKIDVKFPGGVIEPVQSQWAGRVIVDGRPLHQYGRREINDLAQRLELGLPNGTSKGVLVPVIAAKLQVDAITAQARMLASGEVA